jgi:hypothetical protein
MKHNSTTALMGEGGDQGMRASELRALIQEAVLDAQEPLVARIDDLEAALRVLPEKGWGGERKEEQLPGTGAGRRLPAAGVGAAESSNH